MELENLTTRTTVATAAGENGHVRAILPAGYQGTVKVWYSGMWYWRVAEGISLLFWGL